MFLGARSFLNYCFLILINTHQEGKTFSHLKTTCTQILMEFELKFKFYLKLILEAFENVQEFHSKNHLIILKID